MIATPRLASIGLLVAAIGALGLPASPAVAGVYEVRVGCDTVRNAWWPGAMAGMTAYNTCAGATPSGMVARVALTSNPNDKVPYGSRAEWRFVAPAGTAIVGGSLTGDMHTAGGGWQTGLWSDAVGGLFVCSSDCNSTFGFNTGPVGEVHFSSACYRDTGCYRVDREKGGLAAYVALTDATLRLADYYPPAISSDAADGLGARWLNDRTPLGYRAADAGSGVAAVQFWPFYGSGQPDTKFAGCDATRPSPCPATLSDASTGPLTLDPRGLGDGIYTGVLRAIDYSGESSDHAFTYRVDRSRPDAPTAQELLGGTDWRRTNAFDLSWQNPKEPCAQGDAPECAPISSVRYQLCPAGTSDSGRCTTGEVKGNRLERVTDLPVPRVGAWTAKVAAVDAAGNVGEFSDSITLRFDDQPPTAAGFEPQDPSDPRELAVRVDDDTSGVAGGDIELAREGTDGWKALPTGINGDHLTAELDDHLPKGVYRLRAITRDRAGNLAATSERVTGEPAQLTLPIRIPTRVLAGFARVRHRGHGRHRRRIVHLVRTRRVRRLHAVVIHGRLLTRDGQPVADRDLVVMARARRLYARTKTVGVVHTDREGRFRYRTIARTSRTLTFSWPGSNLIKPARRTVKITVPASSTIRVHPRHALNGQTVRFYGRLRGGRVPRHGALVALQAYLPGRGWKIVGDTVFRTHRDGRWSRPYEFGATTGLVRWRFRLMIVPTNDYPFARGFSRVIKIPVRGL